MLVPDSFIIQPSFHTPSVSFPDKKQDWLHLTTPNVPFTSSSSGQMTPETFTSIPKTTNKTSGTSLLDLQFVIFPTRIGDGDYCKYVVPNKLMDKSQENPYMKPHPFTVRFRSEIPFLGTSKMSNQGLGLGGTPWGFVVKGQNEVIIFVLIFGLLGISSWSR